VSRATGAGQVGVPRADPVALTQALTRIDSRNPSLVTGAPGEATIAHYLAHVLRDWDFSVELREVAPGRPNLVARIGPPDSPALMFAGHLDVVGVEGMTHSPFDADIHQGCIFGRGSADMKSGISAMCAAAVRAFDEVGDGCGRQIVIAAVADEEYASAGMRALVQSGVTSEMAIVTEPTRLAICPAHRGFVWAEIEFTGRAAHGSRYDIGVDAIRHAALVLVELDHLEASVLPLKTHPLLGRGSLHASSIEGGSGLSTYPERCAVIVERRTLPGETADTALGELHAACARARLARPNLRATVRLIEAQSPSDVSVDADVVTIVRRALEDEGMESRIEGMSAWTDAAILNAAGIPAICFGPGDISLAHAAEEFVPIEEIEKATRVLTRVARDWLSEKT
jgi:acetylornithine deacetylase